MSSTCLHCQGPISDADAPGGYCCVGCATVAELLRSRGLERYYAFQSVAGQPVTLSARARDQAWLEAPLKDAEARAHGGLAHMDVDVQGLRCSACVWLLRELFLQQPGGAEAIINPAVGRATLTWQPGRTDVAAWCRDVERFGYSVGPARKMEASRSDRVLTRLGISTALTMNSMMFTIAHYVGMTPSDGEVFHLMRWLNLALSVGVLLIGGWEFFSRSYLSLRQRIIPFDLPIALGLSLAFAGSLHVFVTRPDTFSYFDTLNTFTTLMLVGRWLQERVLEQNRRRLLANDGVEGLLARRVREGRVETVAAEKLTRGDTVVVPPGGLLVADGILVDEGASFSLDWINGESIPRSFNPGQTVPAGSFNAHDRAALVVLDVDFRDSSLLPLLSRPPQEQESADDPMLLQRLTRIYVPAVLTLGMLGFLLWLPSGVERAVEVTTSLLVVTCPCALGLAIPLAWQRMAAALRQRGLFVCNPSFMDRAVRVRRVAFDKTGTLTLGALRLANPQELTSLSPALQTLLYNMTARSSHPRSRAVHQAIPAAHARFDASVSVVERPGLGLEARDAQGRLVRLGLPSWTGGVQSSDEGVWLSVDLAVVARFRLQETLRWDARVELDALRRGGHDVVVLSGDAPERVDDVARALNLPARAAVGGLSPQGKAEWLQAHSSASDTLFIGDGVNDRPGFREALCSGTPAVDHPALSCVTDFYYLTPGIGCVRTVLDAARQLQRVTRNIRNVALSYNVLAVSLCLAGVVTPLIAAVAMPASSIFILVYAVRGTTLASSRSGKDAELATAAAPVTA
ncbi:MAG: heavy metal translocating P-type ATPase metal-binding domain-containing protein [Myxococcota bacterium]